MRLFVGGFVVVDVEGKRFIIGGFSKHTCQSALLAVQPLQQQLPHPQLLQGEALDVP